MAEYIEEFSVASTEIPYPRSWIDRFIDWIDRLPVPAWIFYVLSILAIAILSNAAFWIDRGLPFGSIDPLLTIFAVAVLYWAALYQYLTRVGTRSLQIFRPLLEVDDSELAVIDYDLATLPRQLGWLAIPLGLAFAAATILSHPAPFGELVPKTAVPYVLDIVITGFLMSTFFCLIVRSIRQLRMVRKLHGRATNINLLKLAPAHAFSALTARTGIGFLVILIVGLTDPQSLSSGLSVITYVAMGLVTIAVFAVPVMGMQGRLEAEKERLLNEASDLLQIASNRLYNRVRSDNYQDIGDTKDAIEALIFERELLQKVSTWPWDPRTLRGFASALLLPIFLWLVFRLLEGFI